MADLEKTTKKEICAVTVFSILIFAYPIAIVVCLSLNVSKFVANPNVIGEWERYEMFYMFNFIGLAVLLVGSTLLSLKHMRRVFGPESIKEEKLMLMMLYIFGGTYLVRVIFAVLLHFREEWVEHVFAHDRTFFALGVLILWIFWDSVPLMAMMWTHYKNFTSFSNEDILYCEYSVDGSRESFTSADYRYSNAGVMDLIPNNNNLETSGIINLESESELSS